MIVSVATFTSAFVTGVPNNDKLTNGVFYCHSWIHAVQTGSWGLDLSAASLDIQHQFPALDTSVSLIVSAGHLFYNARQHFYNAGAASSFSFALWISKKQQPHNGLFIIICTVWNINPSPLLKIPDCSLILFSPCENLPVFPPSLPLHLSSIHLSLLQSPPAMIKLWIREVLEKPWFRRFPVSSLPCPLVISSFPSITPLWTTCPLLRFFLPAASCTTQSPQTVISHLRGGGRRQKSEN